MSYIKVSVFQNRKWLNIIRNWNTQLNFFCEHKGKIKYMIDVFTRCPSDLTVPYWVRFILALRRVLTPLSASWLTSRYRRCAPAAGRASCESTRTYWAQPSARKQHRVLGNPFPRVRGSEKTGKNRISLKVSGNWRQEIISLGGLGWWEMLMIAINLLQVLRYFPKG